MYNVSLNSQPQIISLQIDKNVPKGIGSDFKVL